MSHVTCHVSHVTCHVSHVMCRVYFKKYSGQSGEAYLWRVCYQRGLPRLVYSHTKKYQEEEEGEKIRLISHGLFRESLVKL